MFDFAAYALHGKMMALEASGKPAFLRDMHGKVNAPLLANNEE